MRLVKIESDHILQTPTAPIKNNSNVEIYDDNGAVSVRSINRLEPEYPIIQASELDKLHERYSPIEISIDNLEANNIFSETEENGGDLSAYVLPGTEDEARYSFSDWDDLVHSINSSDLRDFFSAIHNNQDRVFEDEIYEMASSQDYSLNEEVFHNWLSEKPDRVYQTLVRNCRPGGTNEFEENGAFYDQLANLDNHRSLDGGVVMKGTEKIGEIDQEVEENQYDVKMIEGLVVPKDNQTIEQFLEGFKR